MLTLDLVRQAIRDAELKIRLSNQQPVVNHVGLQAAPPPSHLPNANDGLVYVEGIMASHRSQFGPPPRAQYTHPEQYDDVLRYHVGMPPAPDPYAEARRMHEGIKAMRERQERNG